MARPDQGTYQGPVGPANNQPSTGTVSSNTGLNTAIQQQTDRNSPATTQDNGVGGAGTDPGYNNGIFPSNTPGASGSSAGGLPPILSGSALMSDPSYQAYYRTIEKGLGVAQNNATQQSQYDTTNAQNALQAQGLNYTNQTNNLQNRYDARGLGWGSGQQLVDQNTLAQENALRQSAIEQALTQQLGALNQGLSQGAATANEELTNYGITRAPGVALQNIPTASATNPYGTLPTDPTVLAALLNSQTNSKTT